MMRRRARWGTIVVLAAATTWLAADLSGALAAGQASKRTDTWEMMIQVRHVFGETFDFDHGSSIELDDDIGWGVGFGYNLNEHINFDVEFAWSSAAFIVNYASAEDPPFPDARSSGNADTTTGQFNFTYYFQPKTFTAYVSAGVGWNWLDSTVPAGPPEEGCWWDPWSGKACGAYQNANSASGFNYGLGAGVRFEPKDNVFMRFGVNNNWQDIGDYSKTPDVLSARFDVGWKF